ncbi:sulfonate ABC transporter substrate-binding protein [Citricoccus zhacaiensis]|uniref:Sulfonate ABC transporter substrate-binding protein n=1 Tax=Citricoccus zhacaiensis TaxID=489142 RepID=A0ABQ2LUY6_9MICC|nr:ABC transporter substrate-binding protein [Citricoccus zhacaiensis]GGO43395.1 sulfonate ABC transporter substrate-binding protein [Citricoccus zhacaiensis]
MFTRRLRTVAVTAAALFALTGCGSGSPSDEAGDGSAPATDGGSGGAGELTPIEVGVIPIVDVASIYLGVDEGIFEKHGLDVTLTLAQGGAAIVPAVQSGQMDFGFSNVASLIIGRDAGLPLKIVATGPQSTGNGEDDAAGIMVPADSDIQGVEDLEGKRVAVNTLNNINHATTYEGIKQAGGNVENVDFVEVGFPDMQAQLEAGNVDAITAVEPFVTMAEQGGARNIYGFFAEPVKDLSVSGYFTTDQMMEQEPELVEQFTEAMKESQQYATDHPDEAKAILSSYTSIDPEIVEELTMPLFPQLHNIASLERMAEILQEMGLIEEIPATGDLMVDGAGQ